MDWFRHLILLYTVEMSISRAGKSASASSRFFSFNFVFISSPTHLTEAAESYRRLLAPSYSSLSSWLATSFHNEPTEHNTNNKLGAGQGGGGANNIFLLGVNLSTGQQVILILWLQVMNCLPNLFSELVSVARLSERLSWIKIKLLRFNGKLCGCGDH